VFDRPIRDFAHWTPRAPALVLPGRRVSYAEFNADIDRAGRALDGLGLHPGRGVVSLRAGADYFHSVLLCALTRLGVVTSPAEDDAADVKLVLARDDRRGPAGEDVVAITPGWMQDALGAPHRPLPILEPDPDRVVRVQLSSGTTKRPKRVAATWRRTESITLGNISIYSGPARALWVPLTGADSLMGYAMGVCAWRLGAAAGNEIPVAQLYELMETWPSGIAVVTPTHLRMMLEALPPDFLPRSSWRLQVGGSALPHALAVTAAARLSPDIWIGYGATESSCLATGPALAQADAPGSVGVVVAGSEVEIVGEDGAPVAEGESGELRVRGTRTADGYLGDPEASAAQFRDGWYYSRDLAHRLPDGRIVIEGRIDERMNLGGRKFMPAILERPALECEGVLDCAAFAVPDADGMDQVWLAVEAAADFDKDRLAAHLARYPHLPPRRFAWIEEIPRNAMGKVERDKLRDATLSALARQAGAA
jgi:acyl-CoA synthetase (AMP-forming)/AMP-acid ligase II